MPGTDSRPSRPASSTDIKYLARDIEELKNKKADLKYVEAMDTSMQELIGSKLGDVDQMKKFIIAALVAIAFIVTGVGGTYLVRFANISNEVEAHTTTLQANGAKIEEVSKSLTKHEYNQELQRVQDSVALDGKLGTMEQRLSHAIAKISQGKRIEPISEEQYIERRKEQLQRELRRLEKSRAVKLDPSLKKKLSKSVDQEREQLKDPFNRAR